MKTWGVLILSMVMAGCATAPAPERADRLLNDHLFAAPSQRISAGDVFALSDDMRAYLRGEMADELRAKGPQSGLIDALYDKHQLKLEYDAEITRNAAQTFAARAGNCLSLAIMTAAFAKEVGLTVRYQRILIDDAWSRSGDMYVSSTHVNLTLGTMQRGRILDDSNAPMTIDFVPQDEIRGRRLRVIGEETIVAMYMNNRAAESLARGQVDDAYWWAREAIRQDPRFLTAYNTLGVIYRRHGNLKESEQVLAHALEVEPANTDVLSNLALVFSDEGRVAESESLTQKLQQLQPYPPFYFFNLGMSAMREGDFKTARDLFAKELERDAYYHEFHFWLAAAYVGLGDLKQAREHLAIAAENSATRKEHDLYAAKLDRLSSHRTQ